MGVNPIPEGYRTVPKITSSISGGEFAISQDGCLGATLPGGQMCEVEIVFRPTSVCPRSAVLTFSAPAPCPPFQSQVLLRGNGV